jgi:hypothetical protein
LAESDKKDASLIKRVSFSGKSGLILKLLISFRQKEAE